MNNEFIHYEDLQGLLLESHRIKSFGVYNHISRRVDGSFKGWVAVGFIFLQDGCRVSFSAHQLHVLRDGLKGQYTSSHTTKVERKSTQHGWVERKATDWTFTMKPIKEP